MCKMQVLNVHGEAEEFGLAKYEKLGLYFNLQLISLVVVPL